jgi:hypothetical protein
VAEHALVIGRRQTHARDGLARHDEHMHRRLRRNVPEGDAALVPVNNRGWDFTVADFFKEGLVGHGGRYVFAEQTLTKITLCKQEKWNTADANR